MKLTATEQICRYFQALPNGKQRIASAEIHKEFPSKGRLDKSTKASRVIEWAGKYGLDVQTEGGVEGNPDFYIFTTKKGQA